MNEKDLKKIALELLSHSTHFEQKSQRSLQHAIEALSLLSGLEQVAQKSLKEAFQAAQTAMGAVNRALEKAAGEKPATDTRKSKTAVSTGSIPENVRDSKLYTQWIEKIKPEYRDAFKNPALFQAFLKIQSQLGPAKTEVRATGRRLPPPVSSKPRNTDFSPTAPPQVGATMEKPGSALRRKPLGTHPVLRPKRPS